MISLSVFAFANFSSVENFHTCSITYFLLFVVALKLFSLVLHIFFVFVNAMCRYSYFVVPLDFETFSPQVPQQPRWIQAMTEESSRMRSRRLPITEAQINEQFKKYFGSKRAVKLRVRCLYIISCHHIISQTFGANQPEFISASHN